MTDDREPRVVRTHQLAEELADLLDDMRERLEEVISIGGLAPLELLTLLQEHGLKVPELPPDIKPFAASMIMEAFADQYPPQTGMRGHIDQLFRDRGVKVGDSDTPAIPDITILLRGFSHPVQGVLSKTATGCLKLGTVGRNGAGGPEILLEQVFEYDDVQAIGTTGEIKSTASSSLFTAH